MEKCLYCYKELGEGEKDFHKTCLKKISLFRMPHHDYNFMNITEAYLIRCPRMRATDKTEKSNEEL